MEYNPEYLIVNQLEWTSFRLQLLSPTVLLHWSSIWLCSLWWSAELHNTTANRYSEHYNYFITAFPRFLANKVHFSPFGPSHFLHIQEPRCSMAQLVWQYKSEDFEVGEPTIKFAVLKTYCWILPSKSVVYKIGESMYNKWNIEMEILAVCLHNISCFLVCSQLLDKKTEWWEETGDSGGVVYRNWVCNIRRKSWYHGVFWMASACLMQSKD